MRIDATPGCCIILTLVLARTAIGQAPVPSPQDTVRVWTTTPPRAAWIGTVSRMTGDTLFAASEAGEAAAIPLSTVQGLQLRRGTRPSEGAKMAGALAGAVVGFLVGAKVSEGVIGTDPDSSFVQGFEEGIVIAVGGMLIGALAGGLLASSAREPNWVEVCRARWSRLSRPLFGLLEERIPACPAGRRSLRPGRSAQPSSEMPGAMPRSPTDSTTVSPLDSISRTTPANAFKDRSGVASPRWPDITTVLHPRCGSISHRGAPAGWTREATAPADTLSAHRPRWR